MRPSILAALAFAGLTVAACDKPAPPATPEPDPAPVAPAAKPMTAEERRADLQARSAEAQIEAQLNAPADGAPAPKQGR